MKLNKLKETFTMYSISNREYEHKAGELAQELEDSGWNAMDSRYTGSKYYIIFAKRGEDGKGIWKAVQYSNQLEPRVIDITYEQGIGREPIDDFDGLRRHLGKMLMPHREGLDEATYPRNFKLGENDIQYVKVYNQYGYTIQEIRIDNVKKTFERGNFSIGHDKAYKNRQVYEDFIEELIEMGYKEIPSDYRCLRNKTRKGVPMNESEEDIYGSWSVEFDLTLEGEEVRFDDLSEVTQEHIAECIKDGVVQGEICEDDDCTGWWVAKIECYLDDEGDVLFDSLDEASQEHIADCIKDGYTSGELCVTRDTLTEAPVVKLSSDDLNNPDEVNFRKIIKKAQDEEDAAKAQAELDAKRAELKAQYGDVLDRVAEMPVDTDDNFDRLEALFEVLVPAEGKADTVAGECIRATMRLIYRYYNDGDYFFMGYGLETAAPAVSYLAHRYEDLIYDAQSIGERFANSYDDDKLEAEYEKFLRDLSEVVIEDILEHPELLGELNEMDSRNTDADWIEDEQPRFETDFMIGWDISEMLDADIVSTREVQEYVEDCLNWDDVFNGCEVSYDGGDYVYVSELTFDGYNELMDRVRGKGLDIFWEEFINDHADELEEFRNKEDEPEDEEIDESLKLTEARAVEDSVWKKFVAERKTIKEDISDEIDEEDVDKPFTYEQTEAALREITHNFTDESGEVKCFFRQEKDDGRDILKHYYRVVEVSDGRHSENEPMCYVIAYAERDE